METWVSYVRGTPAGYFELQRQESGQVVNDNYFGRQRQLKLPLSEPRHQGLALAFCGRGECGPALPRHGNF